MLKSISKSRIKIPKDVIADMRLNASRGRTLSPSKLAERILHVRKRQAKDFQKQKKKKMGRKPRLKNDSKGAKSNTGWWNFRKSKDKVKKADKAKQERQSEKGR